MKKGAVLCSIAFVLLFLLALVALLFLAPRICDWYVHLRGMSGNAYTAILAAFYCCTVPAAAALLCLLLLLRNILNADAFSRRNSALMSAVSYCCLLVALITLVAGYWYLPLLLMTATMGFLFLIVRIVRGCFITALALQEENNLTI